ncbi:MAG: hypothetical protein GY711_14785 [bacterium]|nr:hypothetical protein [bacterium]
MATGTWQTTTLSVARTNLTATAVGSLLLIAGGRTDDAPSDRVDIYDAASDQWSTSSLSVGRSDLASASLGSKAYFAGGRKETAQGFSDPVGVIDAYDVESGTWSALPIIGRYGLTATTVGSKLLVAGGVYVSSMTATPSSTTVPMVLPRAKAYQKQVSGSVILEKPRASGPSIREPNRGAKRTEVFGFRSTVSCNPTPNGRRYRRPGRAQSSSRIVTVCSIDVPRLAPVGICSVIFATSLQLDPERSKTYTAPTAGPSGPLP